MTGHDESSLWQRKSHFYKQRSFPDSYGMKVYRSNFERGNFIGVAEVSRGFKGKLLWDDVSLVQECLSSYRVLLTELTYFGRRALNLWSERLNLKGEGPLCLLE